jgi:hypothetical protein
MQAEFSVALGRDDPALEVPWVSNDPSVLYYDLKISPESIERLPEVMAYPELRAFLVRINAPGFPLATAKCDAWPSRDISPEEEVFGADRKFVSYVDLVFEEENARCSLARHEAFAERLCRLLTHAPDLAATVELVIRRCYFHPEASRSGPCEGCEAEREPALSHQPQLSLQPSCSDARSATGDVVDAGQTPVASGPADGEQASAASMTGRVSHAPNADLPGSTEQIIRGSMSASSIDGFCLTVYVTGLGDEDRDPRQPWEIALTLLQNALVQVMRS